MVRIGHGIDAHRFTDNRPLMLCGVRIPYKKGLSGHSDADVALHALIDALLGAAAKGDIGTLFPDTDPRYKDIASTLLLKEVAEQINLEGFRIGNVDITIVLEEPRLRPHILEMRTSVARILGLAADCVSVKATTTETMGFSGRKEGILAFATAGLYR